MFRLNILIVFVILKTCYSQPDGELENLLSSCESSKNFTVCKCGKEGAKVAIPLEMCSEKDPLTEKVTCEPCNSHLFANDLCTKYENCETCLSGLNKCLSCPKGKFGSFCTKDIVKNLALNLELEDMKLASFPIRVRIPRGAPLRDNRILRAPDACEYPTTLTTAEVDCILYTTKIKCTEICVWGHTLPEGRTKEIQCRYENNNWTPSGFAECQPYVDCSLKFKSPGDMYCVSNKLDAPTVCDLACNEYDDIPEVSQSSYTCGLNGEWDPSLPFCIEKAREIETVPAPTH